MLTGIFTEQQLADMKTEFNELLRSTNRPGIENLINWLETSTDFYVAPASQMYHGAFPGGLLSHSLNVYHAALEFREVYNKIALPEKNVDTIKDDQLILATLLHDLCKTNIYKEKEKWYKDEAQQWHKYMSYEIVDSLPWGHGAKSCLLAQYFIYLENEVIAPIMWHMASLDNAITNPTNKYENKPMMQSLQTIPLTIILQQADMAASFMMEAEIDQKEVNRI